MTDRLSVRPVQISDAERLSEIYSYYVHNTAVSFEYEAPSVLSSVKDCYNLQLHISPLMLSRQSGNELDIVWPEKVSLFMEDHDSFFLRDGEKLFFNRWFEEGEGVDYRYWEETIVRDLKGNVIEILLGDVMMMPNGEIWHLK